MTSSSRILRTSGRPYLRRTAWHAIVEGLSEWSDIGLLSMLGERDNEQEHEHEHEHVYGYGYGCSVPARGAALPWDVHGQADELEVEIVRERDALPGSRGSVGESGRPGGALNLDSASEEVEEEEQCLWHLPCPGAEDDDEGREKDLPESPESMV